MSPDILVNMLEELKGQVYLHPEEHAAQRHIVLHQTSKVLVCCSHHLVPPLPVEVFNLGHMRLETLEAPLVE